MAYALASPADNSSSGHILLVDIAVVPCMTETRVLHDLSAEGMQTQAGSSDAAVRERLTSPIANLLEDKADLGHDAE